MNKFEIDLVKDHVDDPTVREIFADSVRMVSCTDGVMNLELTVRRPHLVQSLPAAPKMRTHTVARLALTVPAGTLLMQQLKTNLEQQSALQQMIPPAAPVAPPPKH
jgi:hypothetical protein